MDVMGRSGMTFTLVFFYASCGRLAMRRRG